MAKHRKAKTTETASLSDAAQQRKWRTESDLRSLREAADIKSDSSRMKAAQRMADKEVKALKKIGSKK